MSGIYIHIPFCKQACHYCDFHFSTQLGKRKALLVALQRELELRSAEFANTTVETIYFGGGTPSLLQIKEIQQLLHSVYTNYRVALNPEITLEANPDDLNFEKLQGLKQASINRLSIGIQSFFDEDLTFMHRAHNADEAESCILEAKKLFTNISIDLIYGIPGMSLARWIQNIEKALTYDLPHISSYALTVEPKTALASFIEKGKVAPLDDDLAEAHFDILLKMLESKGYRCYEISNFGKENFYSKNNTAYWQGKSYLGIGPSAHSFNGKSRKWNVKNNVKYTNSIARGILPMEEEILSKQDRYNEYVMTRLRTIWGVSFVEIDKNFGRIYVEYLTRQSEKFITQQLLYLDNDHLKVSRKGKFLCDGIAADLFMVNLGTN